MSASMRRVSPSQSAVVGHRQHEANVRERALELLELVEKAGRLPVAVRIDERDPVRQALLGDVPEHAPEDGDPDAAGDEHVRLLQCPRGGGSPLGLLGGH